MSKKLQKRTDFFDDWEEWFKPFRVFMDEFPSKLEERFSGLDMAESHSESVYSLVQNGKTIEIRTKDGETTIKVNGKEYVPKEDVEKK